MHIDFRLKVFHISAKHLNFSKAAKELFISQPAVSKNINEMEKQIGASLFERNGGKLTLSEAREIMYKYSKLILDQYNHAEFEINLLKGKLKGQLRMGASTTISQYILPKLLAKFSETNIESRIKVDQHNSKYIEELLLRKEIDLGVTEGLTSNNSIKFTPFLKDEVVLVTNYNHKTSESIKLEELPKYNLIVRESGSGTRDIIESKLYQLGFSLLNMENQIILSSTESIKQFIQNSNSFAFLSIHSITKEINDETLKIIDIENFKIERDFYFAHLHGALNGLSEVFFRFCYKNKSIIYQ